ncbi:MAG TPA: ferredoxin [Acidimicrobiales bacterium]
MAYEVRVERGRCIGTKACINSAPGTFELDPTLVAVVRDPEGDSEADVVDAAESCPTGAISVWKDGVKLA